MFPLTRAIAALEGPSARDIDGGVEAESQDALGPCEKMDIDA